VRGMEGGGGVWLVCGSEVFFFFLGLKLREGGGGEIEQDFLREKERARPVLICT
jgi:hypothetical protein